MGSASLWGFLQSLWMVRVLFKYLNIISQNQLGTLIAMTTDGPLRALTTLLFEVVASEICDVSLSSVLVRGRYQPQTVNETPGGMTIGDLSRSTGAVILLLWGDSSFIYSSAAFCLARYLKDVTYSKSLPSSEMREKIQITLQHVETKLGDAHAAETQESSFPPWFTFVFSKTQQTTERFIGPFSLGKDW